MKIVMSQEERSAISGFANWMWKSVKVAVFIIGAVHVIVEIFIKAGIAS